MENPLLIKRPFPNFKIIHVADIEPAVKQRIEENKKLFYALMDKPTYAWTTLMQPLEEMHDTLNQMWSPISHLHSVMSSESLRKIYQTCLLLLTEYHTELMQNEKFYHAIQSLSESSEYEALEIAQKKIIENDLRDLRLAGVHLGADKKARFVELQKKLSQLCTRFSENILDATDAWYLHVTEVDALVGLPEQTIQLAEQNALQRDLKGWVFTLDHACYSTVMKYLKRRDLRSVIYEAYSTRASEVGPQAGQFDNTGIMEDIVKTRHELAQLLGFKHYAEYSLQTKMAKTPEQVLSFLQDLLVKSKPMAEKEMVELSVYAKAKDGVERLEAWDVAYYSEMLREEKYAISQEELRPYFPVPTVLKGLFEVTRKLYGMHIIECENTDSWHPDVRFFEIQDAQERSRGYFYIDLYARPNKKEGAWMDECRVRRKLPDGSIQTPIAFLTCNFMRPLGNQPALLTHDDVLTLFHEFGHCLHHLLTQVDYASLAGINGVPWDAVEFPSQFFEFWCYEKEVLQQISSHVRTGEPLPDCLYDKLLAAKNFQAGMHMLRQLEFALFDFNLHLTYRPENSPMVQKVLDEVRQAVAVVPTPKFNRFQHSFSHIFAGGYAAGYYSYKWAEVLSSDAYSLFEEKGIFDSETGKAFLQNILEQGGVYEPMDLFVKFRGRKPTVDALLRHCGLK